MTRFVHSLIATTLLCMATSFALDADPLARPGGWATGTVGGIGGSIDTASDSASLATALAKPLPRIVFVKGTVTGVFNVSVGNRSVLGLPGAVLRGNLNIVGTSAAIVRNVIVRNLTILPSGTCTGDFGVGTCEDKDAAVRVSYARGVWLDHLTLTDGLYSNLDIVHGSDSLTLSWIRQSYTRTDTSHQFANLIGASDRNGAEDSLRLRFTWHHSLWGDNIRERMPRVRFSNAHLYGNVFRSSRANYCIRAAWRSDLLVEANVFTGTQSPLDIYDTNARAQSRFNLFASVTGDTAGNGIATAPPYAYALDTATACTAPAGVSVCDPFSGLRSMASAVSNAATGAGANLTWTVLPVGLLSTSRTGALRTIHLAGGTRLVNEGTQRQILSLTTVSGRTILPATALEPGAWLTLPQPHGLSLLHQRSEESEGTRLLGP